MAKTVDVVMLRERRKRRRRLVKALIVLAVVLFGAMLYTSREKWFPQLEQIGTQHETITRTDADFILEVSGGVEYHAAFVNHDLFVLCDKYIYIYDMDGEQIDSRQHAYSNAVMKTNADRALLYSHNGKNFRVDTEKKKLYELATEQPIWFAVLSEDGRVAVVTESETYACCLFVYDANGKELYTRNCLERLIDVSFQGNGCILSSVSSENGTLVTVLKSIDFSVEYAQEAKWVSTSLATLCWHTYAMQDNGAFVIGDTAAAYYNNAGNLVNEYLYEGTMIACDVAGSRAAVLLKNENKRQSTLLLFSDCSESPEIVTFDSICKNISIQDDTVYVLDTGFIRGYSFTGAALSCLEVGDVYDKILKNGKYFYLLGYDRIQRVEGK